METYKNLLVVFAFVKMAISYFSEIPIGGIITRPSNACLLSDRNATIVFNCTTASEYLPWWTIDNDIYGNYTITNFACESSGYFSHIFMTESLGPGSCSLIFNSSDYYSRLSPASSFVCTDSTFSLARAIILPVSECPLLFVVPEVTEIIYL